MWQDELYFEDDDAAMAAYLAMVGDEKKGKAEQSDDSDDDDFMPEIGASSSSRRPTAKPKRASSKTTKSKRPAASIPSRSSSPAATPQPPPAPKTADPVDEDELIDIDGDIVSTPDIGHLEVSDSVDGTPQPSDTTMDIDSGSPAAVLQALRQREQKIRSRILVLEQEIADLEKRCGVEGSGDAANKVTAADLEEFKAPEWSVPIRANVMNFDWEKLAQACQFDVILMDPPWQLASQAPTRGVAIAYQQLPDVCIESLPIDVLQTSGFIFIWVINNKYTKAFQLMKQWGYKYVDDIAWVKQTVNRRMAKGHGYYLQHAKETCLVGKKGPDPPNLQRSVASDVIFSERRGQSQKPEELYEIIEQLVPGGRYLEIFGRKNNLRDYWVTVGNEL